MAETKRIMITLPECLLEEIDELVELHFRSRSQCVRQAMKMLIRERKKEDLRKRMRKGYIKMGQLNMMLAEEGIASDCADMEEYTRHLAESEPDANQKRRHILR
jgi:CopG family transcriptional regulator/antitoxin EndoAI